MQDKLILSLDQGTTSSRSLLVSNTGQICFTAQEEFDQIFPNQAWVEHNPEQIWQSQFNTIKEAVQWAKENNKEIICIGITNQRETTIVWNRHTGEAIHNAIVWQDRRTSEYCQSLINKGFKDTIHKKTGLLIDAYFSASKLKWILDNVDGARQLAINGDLAFGTVDSWLMWKLSEGKIHATDVSNASRTMLFNIETLEWDTELLEIFDIPSSVLPKVNPSSFNYGHSSAGAIGEEIMIGSAIGDQQSALFGQMCIEKGEMKNTYGTGCFLVLNTGDEIKYSKHQLLTTVAWQIGDSTKYALEGSVFIGGAIIQWLRDGLEIIKSSGEIEELCNSVDDSDGVYMVPALTGLGAPHWDSEARGTIFGITRGTTKAHIARAAVESIAFQVNDLVSAMNKDLGFKIKVLKVDGGASINNFLMQFQSDLIQADVIRPKNYETTALGTAYLAGLSSGMWKDIKEIKSMWEIDRVFKPQLSESDMKNIISKWDKAVSRTTKWL